MQRLPFLVTLNVKKEPVYSGRKVTELTHAEALIALFLARCKLGVFRPSSQGLS